MKPTRHTSFQMASLLVLLLLSAVLVSFQAIAFEVAIQPAAPGNDDDLQCFVNGETGDDLEGSYIIRWHLQGSAAVEQVGPTLDASETVVGDSWVCDAYDIADNFLASSPAVAIQDNFAPVVELVSPPDGTAISDDTTTFQFTVTDEDDSVSCSMSVADSAATEVFSSASSTVPATGVILGMAGSFLAGLDNGTYTWHVTCSDSASQAASSDEWTFTIARERPTIPVTITLLEPENGATVDETTVDFSFALSTPRPAMKCFLRTDTDGVMGDYDGITVNVRASDAGFLTLNDLIDLLDDFLGRSPERRLDLPPILGGRVPAFTLDNIPPGEYHWHVVCTPLPDGENVVSDTWTFTVEPDHIYYPAVVQLSPPDGAAVSPGTVTFTYTVTDADDEVVACTLGLAVEGSTILPFAVMTDVPTDGSPQSFSVPDVAEGDYQWSVSCRDDTGLRGYGPIFDLAVREGAGDVESPVIALITPPDGAVILSSDATISYTVEDNSGGSLLCAPAYHLAGEAEVVLPIVSVASGTPLVTATITDLEDGTYAWLVRCVDLSANLGVSEERTFTIDTSVVGDLAPTITLVEPADGATLTTSTVTLTYTVTDDHDSTATCYVLANVFNGGGDEDAIQVTEPEDVPADGTVQSFTLDAAIANGVYTWAVACFDSRGSPAGESMSLLQTFTIDVDVPDDLLPAVTLLSPADDAVIATSDVTVSFTVTDEDDSVACQLAFASSGESITLVGVEFTAPADGSPQSLSIVGLVDGAYDWTVQCYDVRGAASRAGPTPRTFTVDLSMVNLPPTVTLIQPADEEIISTNDVVVSYTVGDDRDDTLSCQLHYGTSPSALIADGSQLSTADESTEHSFILEDLVNAEYFWTVECTDSSGAAVSASMQSFTVDSTGVDDVDNPPIVTLLAPPDGSSILNTDDTSIIFSVVDEDETFSCDIFMDLATAGVWERVGTVEGPILRDGGVIMPTEVPVSLSTIESTAGVMFQNRRYMWNVHCTDGLGNASFAPETWTFVVGEPVVPSDVPDVHISTSASSGDVPLTVIFDASVEGDAPFSFYWTFDDGTSSDLEDPVHTFTEPGTYRVELTVSDRDGQTKTVAVLITAKQPGIIIDPARDLRIERIALIGSPGLDEAVVGEDILLAITVKNDASVDFEDLHISLLAEGIGVRRMIGPFDLEQHERVTKVVRLEIPDDAVPGEYAVRVSVSNDDIRRVKHRDITIVW